MKRKHAYLIMIYLILMLDLSFFYLSPISSISRGIIGNYQKMGIVCFLFILVAIYSNEIFNKEKKYLFAYEIIILIILFIFRFISSYFTYNQSVLDILSVSNEYLTLLAYFIICLYLSKEKKIINLEYILLKASTLLAGLMIVQYIVYNFTNKLFLYIDKEVTLNSIRYGSIRIYENDYLFIFIAVLSFGIFLNNKKDNIKLILTAFVLSMLQIIFISKSRMGLIMVILSCIYMIFKKYKNNRIKQIILGFISLIVIIGFIQIPAINQALTSINLKDDSLRTRIHAIEFYGKQLEDNKLLGVGFIKPIEGDESYYMVKGKNGLFYKCDMGIFGSIHTFGIVFIIWYFIVINKIRRVLKYISKQKKEKEFIEIYGISFLTIVGSIAMNPFDAQRVVIYSFILGLIDYSYKIVKKENEYVIFNTKKDGKTYGYNNIR